MNTIYFEAKGEALLERIGMTKSEFARKMGIRKQNVKALFKTKNLETIYKASEVLGVPFEMLVGYIDEMNLSEIPVAPPEEENLEVINGRDGNLTFESLVGRINFIQDSLQAQAAHAINLSLTARNWLVGYYIVEFEQNGKDRAKYGEKLLGRLSESLNQRGFNLRRLRDYRHVYQVYSKLGPVIVKFLENNRTGLTNNEQISIRRLKTAELQEAFNQRGIIRRSNNVELEKWCTPPERLFYRLNYTILSFYIT